MAPRKPHSLADGEETHTPHRLRPCRSVHEHDGSATTKKKKKKKLRLNELEGNKSMYLASVEYQEGDQAAYVVRCIKLSDLLSSDSDDPLQLRQVAYAAGVHLPASIGAGIFGSQIIFAGGMKPSFPIVSLNRPDIVWHRNVYAFETDPSNNQNNQHGSQHIRKMNATLLQAKYYPLIVELGGKLYALSCRQVPDPPSFEVFDPQSGQLAGWPCLILHSSKLALDIRIHANSYAPDDAPGTHKRLVVPYRFNLTLISPRTRRIVSPSNSCLFASSSTIPTHPVFLDRIRLIAFYCDKFVTLLA